jgi:hypothetical protein
MGNPYTPTRLVWTGRRTAKIVFGLGLLVPVGEGRRRKKKTMEEDDVIALDNDGDDMVGHIVAYRGEARTSLEMGTTWLAQHRQRR